MAGSQSTSTTASSPTLYGYMFEDINNSGDGGLYAELLQNRALQKVDVSNQTAALFAWEAVGNAIISAVNDTAPVSSALPNSLKIVSGGAKGGVANTGYWGIKILSSWSYNVTFWAKSATNSSTSLNVSLVSNTTGSIFASKSVKVSSTTWKEYTFKLKPDTDALDLQNTFQITFDGQAGETLYLSALSLFPPTFKGRANGMRIDIADTIYATKPSFFRFPGGNNLEGQSFDTRWKWNETLGPLLDRPGRMGDWSYINTDGLGLMEYLHWLDDLEVMGIMAVWSGYSLDGLSVPEDAMGPYVQEALDQIEFVIGDAGNSSLAQWRAELGHPEPWNITYIEIGNEDFFANATYVYRWKLLTTAIAEKYPHLKLLSTDLNGDDGEQNLVPAPQYSDRHHYDVPGYFIEQFNQYDNAPRPPLGPQIFEGEYAVINNLSYPNYNLWNSSEGRLNYSDAQAAVSEAVFMIGLERNSDLVFSAAYAPMLQNINRNQWTPNLILFDAGTVYPSASYEVQKVFSVNRGDWILPMNVSGDEAFTTLFAVASYAVNEDIVYLKMSNPSGNATEVSVSIPSINISHAHVTVLTSPNYWDNNQPGITPTFVPKTNKLYTGEKGFSYTIPAWAVVVVKVCKFEMGDYSSTEKILSVNTRRGIVLFFSIAAALASGTSYVFGAYAPQLAKKLGLSASQINLIGTSGNFGVYISGPLWGLVTDKYGPKIPLASASVLLLGGYLGQRAFYTGFLPWHGQTLDMLVICLCTGSAGFGSSAGLAASVNSVAKSFPDTTKGTAVSLTLAGFGLSAFMFSTIAHTFVPGDTSSLLTILAIGCFLPMFIGFFIIRPVLLPENLENNRESGWVRLPTHTAEENGYGPVPGTGDASPEPVGVRITPSTPAEEEYQDYPASGSSSAPPLVRARSKSHMADETTENNAALNKKSAVIKMSPAESFRTLPPVDGDDSERLLGGESLDKVLSRSSAVSLPAEMVNISGWALFKELDFWIIAAIVSCLSGTGLMWINNCGLATLALFSKGNPDYDPAAVAALQATQVSIISIFNCAGRIIIGVASDVFKHKYSIRRIWFMCLVSASFIVSQLVALSVTSVSSLWLVSSLLGISYGGLFGLAPVVVLEWFGMSSFSMNWGLVSVSPIVGGNVANILFGKIYDSHTVGNIPIPANSTMKVNTTGSFVPRGVTVRIPAAAFTELVSRGGPIATPGDKSHECYLGQECYVSSFHITLFACCLALVLSIFAGWRRERQSKEKRRKARAAAWAESDE